MVGFAPPGAESSGRAPKPAAALPWPSWGPGPRGPPSGRRASAAAAQVLPAEGARAESQVSGRVRGTGGRARGRSRLAGVEFTFSALKVTLLMGSARPEARGCPAGLRLAGAVTLRGPGAPVRGAAGPGRAWDARRPRWESDERFGPACFVV